VAQCPHQGRTPLGAKLLHEGVEVTAPDDDLAGQVLTPYAGALVDMPALYVTDDRDLVVRFPGMDQLILNLSKFVPQLRHTMMLPGCGHWTQQERAAEVNAAML